MCHWVHRYAEHEIGRSDRALAERAIVLIAAKNNEPDWFLQLRLQSFRHWLTRQEPAWYDARHEPVDDRDLVCHRVGPRGVLASGHEPTERCG